MGQAIPDYDDQATRLWLYSSIVWLTIVDLFGLILALELISPNLFAGIPWLLFGRIRPLHVNGVIFAWLSMMYWGALFYMIPRLTGNRKMWSEQLAVWTGWGFNLWFLLGIFTILAGRTQGREYAEFIWPLDIMLIVLWFSNVFNMLMTVAVRRVRPLYVTTWWALAAPLWLGADYIIGTLHGLLQLLPATAQYLTTPEELPNIHAQLNMVGGVLLVLIGVVYLLLPELVGQPIDQRLARITLVGIGSGISGYYVVTLVAGLLRFGYLLQGMDNVQSALHLGWVTPALLMLTSLPMLVGYGAFGLAVLRVTGGYRTTMAQELRQAPARFNGPIPTRLKRMPMVYILGMEAAGSLFGWPGLGWLYAGQAMP